MILYNGGSTFSVVVVKLCKWVGRNYHSFFPNSWTDDYRENYFVLLLPRLRWPSLNIEGQATMTCCWPASSFVEMTWLAWLLTHPLPRRLLQQAPTIESTLDGSLRFPQEKFCVDMVGSLRNFDMGVFLCSSYGVWRMNTRNQEQSTFTPHVPTHRLANLRQRPLVVMGCYDLS